jgi:HEAT repeat protein
LLLRAAVEALGIARTGNPDDVPRLVPYLDHPSRDIRAATARALRDMCNTGAIVPLRTRYQNEQVDQVRLAISTALRDLGQCSQ